MADPNPRPDPYAAWRNPNYRYFAGGWFLLTFGKMIETVAVGVHIYDRTRDPLALGWIGLVQMLTPDAMRGRVSAVNGVFIVASNDLGGVESGVTARLFGAVTSVVLGGAGTILAVLGAARLWPEILGIGSLKDVRPDEAALAQRQAETELAARG